MARDKLPLTAVAFLNLQADGDGRLRSISAAAEACGTVWAWAYAHHKLDLGHWPSQAEYAAYWKISERSAQREWAAFRRAFPGEESPERLARWLLSEVSSRIEDKSSVLSVAAPAELQPA